MFHDAFVDAASNCSHSKELYTTSNLNTGDKKCMTLKLEYYTADRFYTHTNSVVSEGIIDDASCAQVYFPVIPPLLPK